jgi:hypothetical protein
MLVAMVLALALAGPAAAKGAIVEANISGPGLGGGSGSVGGGGGGAMRIEAPATDRMWESGILDDTRIEGSLSEFGLISADLGPKYVVTYRFDFGPSTADDVIRQDLYPYAEGGPVTYTPPGQQFTTEEFDAPIPSGWYQTTPAFFDFLVENGLPATNPVGGAAKPAPRIEPAADAAPANQPAPWAWVIVVIGGLAALALATPAVRRRVMLVVTRVNH